MFDLNKSISEWKNAFKNKESFSSENIDELESHLVVQITELKDTGLSDEEAYWVAQKRIGTIDSLYVEFTKINKLNILKKKIYWMLTGIAGMLMYIFFVNSSYYIFVIICMLLNIDPVSFTIIYNSFNEVVIIFGGIFILWIMSSKKSKLFDKYYFNNLNKVNLSKFIVIGALTFVLSSIFYFYYSYELSTDVNRWISNSDSLNEFKELNKILNPLQFIFNSFLILVVYYYSFVNKRKLEISRQ